MTELTVNKPVLFVLATVRSTEAPGNELGVLCVSGSVYDGGQPGLLLSGWQLFGQRLLSAWLPAGKLSACPSLMIFFVLFFQVRKMSEKQGGGE